MLSDIFTNPAFGLTQMTKAINKAPFVPGRIRDLGLFAEQGVNTTSVLIEEQSGQLGLIPSQSRLGPAAVNLPTKRKVRPFAAVHLPLEDSVMSETIQGIRAFGEESALTPVATVINQRLTTMRNKHELTLEYHRLGAIKGIILDADGTTVISNLFTVFGLSQTSIPMALTTSTTEVIVKTSAIRRAVDNALGGTPYARIHAFVGSNFFDKLVTLPSTKDAFKFQQSQMLRTDLGATGNLFEIGGITFEEMSRTLNGQPLIAVDEGYAFPIGAPDLFLTYFAPGTFLETANTIGLPFYAKQEAMKYNRGVEIYTESNPLNLCTRPESLIKLTTV